MSSRRWLVAAILAVCLGGPIAESFDWWDLNQPVGDDTETNLVVVALSVGLAVSVAAIVVQWFASFVSQPLSRRWLSDAGAVLVTAPALPGHGSLPRSPLRI
jgi:hypothetical protein